MPMNPAFRPSVKHELKSHCTHTPRQALGTYANTNPIRVRVGLDRDGADRDGAVTRPAHRDPYPDCDPDPDPNGAPTKYNSDLSMTRITGIT